VNDNQKDHQILPKGTNSKLQTLNQKNMKTMVYVITLLIGLAFLAVSCQKDNGVVPFGSDNNPNAEDAYKAEDPGNIWNIDASSVTNLPDPFSSKTVIKYKVNRSAYVTLVVTGPDQQSIDYLVSRFHRPGVYKVGYDASGKTNGKYMATLKVGNRIVKKEMTKIADDKLPVPGEY
jgi:hypothetical protein